MGFGLLFIGYLFMFSFRYQGFDILPDIIGFLISYAGIRKLADYECGFDNLKKYMYCIIPASGVTFVSQLIIFIKKETFTLLVLWNYVYIAFLLVYNILLLLSIYKIADDTDTKSIKAKAVRNLVLTLVYYAVILFFELPVNKISELKTFLETGYAFGFITYIFGYVWLILNSAAIFSCYMWICQEGDEDMPAPPKKNIFKRDSDETQKHNDE